MAKNNDESSIWRSTLDGIADAIADVRNKVIYESWFGLKTTDDLSRPSASGYRSVMYNSDRSFDEQWAPAQISSCDGLESKAVAKSHFDIDR